MTVAKAALFPRITETDGICSENLAELSCSIIMNCFHYSLGFTPTNPYRANPAVCPRHAREEPGKPSVVVRWPEERQFRGSIVLGFRTDGCDRRSRFLVAVEKCGQVEFAKSASTCKSVGTPVRYKILRSVMDLMIAAIIFMPALAFVAYSRPIWNCCPGLGKNGPLAEILRRL
jgi:hypothetical protein